MAEADAGASAGPEAAAAACAALACEYTAVAAARGIGLAPLLREAAETLRQRAKAATLRASPHGTGRRPRRH